MKDGYLIIYELDGFTTGQAIVATLQEVRLLLSMLPSDSIRSISVCDDMQDHQYILIYK